MTARTKMALLLQISSILTLLFQSCVIPSGPVVTQLKTEIVGSDTIAPFGTISVKFSDPLQDSSIVLKLIPDQLPITVTLNSDRRAAQIKFPISLNGNRRYSLVPRKEYSTSSGSSWGGSDTIHFFTRDKEQEPNNSYETADSVKSITFGMLPSVDDTDWYTSGLGTKKVFFQVYDADFSFKAVDSSGKIMYQKVVLTTDTLVLAASFNIPLYIIISSRLRSTGGYYAVGYLR